MKRIATFVTLLTLAACSGKTPFAPTYEPASYSSPASTAATVQAAIGAPFIGPLTANGAGQSGTMSVTFSNEGPSGVVATISFTGGGTYTGAVSGNMSSLTATAAGPTGGCIVWSGQGAIVLGTTTDTFIGTYSATCHNSASAVLGDSGKFSLSRAGTLTPPPPLPAACTYTVSPMAFGSLAAPLDHNGHPNLVVTVTASASSCAWTAVSNNPSWLKGVRVAGTAPPSGNGVGSTTLTFDVEGNKDVTTRTGTLTVAGHTVTVYQDKGGK